MKGAARPPESGLLAARDSRALTWGGLLLLIVLLVFRGVPAFQRWDSHVRDDARMADADLARARAAITNARVVNDSLIARQRRFVALAPRIVGGDSPSAAAATLGSLVSGAAELAGMTIGSVQVSSDTAARGVFVRVSATADVTGDITGVTAMIASLEGGPALLAVRELTIVQPDPAAGADRAETLRVQLRVEGLALNHSRSDEPRARSVVREPGGG